MKVLFTFFFSFAFFGCGSETYEVPRTGKPNNPNAAAYSWKEMKGYCFNSGCHNGAAPTIPSNELGFKASKKVMARIKDGTMPPNNSRFSIDRAVAYLKSEGS